MTSCLSISLARVKKPVPENNRARARALERALERARARKPVFLFISRSECLRGYILFFRARARSRARLFSGTLTGTDTDFSSKSGAIFTLKEDLRYKSDRLYLNGTAPHVRQ